MLCMYFTSPSYIYPFMDGLKWQKCLYMQRRWKPVIQHDRKDKTDTNVNVLNLTRESRLYPIMSTRKRSVLMATHVVILSISLANPKEAINAWKTWEAQMCRAPEECDAAPLHVMFHWTRVASVVTSKSVLTVDNPCRCWWVQNWTKAEFLSLIVHVDSVPPFCSVFQG